MRGQVYPRGAMKAAVYERYGPPEVVVVRDVPKPSPQDDQLLVKVRATTVAAGDWRMRTATPVLVRLFNGLFRPRRAQVLGFELAGDVEAVGKNVQRFRPGDAVFAFTGFGFGAHAQYCCLRESGKPSKVGLVAHKPANLSYEEAAAVPVGALTAQGFLRRARVEPGAEVLVYGASGSVGTFAVQLAAAQGARVTAVCSGANAELVRGLGAADVIDYTKEDFAARGPRFDVVLDAVGKAERGRCKRALKPGGRLETVRKDPALAGGDLEALRELLEAGKLRPVIDRRFPLEEIVEAHRYVEAGHKKGNVVISVGHPSTPSTASGGTSPRE